MNIYVASSWRNYKQLDVVKALKGAGHDVYDFHNPSEVYTDEDGRLKYRERPEQRGFSWNEIDPQWRDWNHKQYLRALYSQEATRGFLHDYDAMLAANVCVLVLPAGASAHLEAGYFVGNPNKSLIILLPDEWDDHDATLYLRAQRHSVSDAPCPACGDLDGCHLAASEQRRRDALKFDRYEPELMYRMALGVCETTDEVLACVEALVTYQ
jgi:hypothetical protein